MSVDDRRVIHQLFERQVEKSPTSQALIFGDKSINYEMLNSRSNQLARKIRVHYESQVGKSFSKGVLIPLYLDRSFEMVIAILAVLKLGGAYVPIDPTFPDERVRYILKDTNAKVVVTQSWHKENLKKLGYEDGIVQADEMHEIESYSKRNLDVDTNGDDLAYVIYTSGTTGHPKGVMVPQKGVVNRIQCMQKQYPLCPEDRVLQKTPYSFDVSVWELLWANWYGAAIVIAKPDGHKDANYLHQLIIDQAVTVLHFVPSMLSVFLSSIASKTITKYQLKRIFCSGEALSDGIKDQFYEVFEHRVMCTLHNFYGPTEASIEVSFHDCAKDKKVTIGKPIDNMKLYVLDDDLKPRKKGQVGELCISGIGLARGYLNLTKLSDSAFIINPFASAIEKTLGYDRLYKTGDLVRELDNGEIEYVGRNDSQVKIRGFRIETSEIEQVLSKINGIRQCCVVVRVLNNKTYHVNSSSEKSKACLADSQHQVLVAYYTLDKAINLSHSAILEHLQNFLPEYMVPNFIVKLEDFPLTANGKLDKKALPEVSVDVSGYVAPSTERENKVCQIWQGALSVDKVGVMDNFLALGGNSVLAVDVVVRMKQLVGCHFDALDLIKGKTIKELLSLEYIENQYEQYPSQAQMQSDDLHHFEKSILSHVLATNNPLIYNESFTIEYAEHISFKVFKVAIDYLMMKYELLNSSYYEEKQEGKLYRRLNLDQSVVCQHVKLNKGSKLELFCRQIDQTPFDIEKDKLIRFYLIDVDARQYVFISFFHALLDATSITNIILPDLYLCLQEDKRSSVKQPIADFTALSMSINDHYQRNMQQKIKYWQQKLDSYEALDLGFSKTTEDVKGQQLSCNWATQLRHQIKYVANSLKISEYSVLYGLFTLMLAKISQQTHFAVITNIDERMYVPQCQSVAGCFINNVIIDANITQNKTLKEHLVNTHKKVIESIEQALPYESLLAIDREQVLQLSDIQFNLQPEEVLHYPYMQTQINSHSGYVKHGLYFELDLKQDQLLCRVEFESARYPRYFVESLLDSYSILLEGLEKSLDHKISEISLLSAKDYQKVVYDWNSTEAPFPKDKTIYQLFEEQVAKTPNNIAIVYEGKELTYQELNIKSNQLARHIRESFLLMTGNELMPDTLIALFLERSLEMIISIFAVLKAGAAYVPIDPNFPQERIVYILKDTKSKLLLTQSNVLNNCPFYIAIKEDIKCILVDKSDCYKGDSHNLIGYSSSSDLAYVIYTSGTTGKPKGVMIEHEAYVSFISRFNHKLVGVGTINILSLTNYVFDIFGLEYALAIAHGGTVVLSSIHDVNDQDLDRCNIVQQTPRVLYELCQQHQHKLKNKICLVGGELANEKIIESLLSSFMAVYNVYGPTETVIWSAIYKINQSSDYAVIGRPLDNEQLYLLDHNLKPVIQGGLGELYIGGVGLARGYLNKPELTDKSFFQNYLVNQVTPSKSLVSQRLYKTGDICRYQADGCIEYIGRSDFQIKIRGYRVELGEIESRLSQIVGIKQSCVIAKNSHQDNCYLVGYYVLDRDNQRDLSHEAIHNELKLFLPDYMLPSMLIELPSLPLTINGKLDRSALPEPHFVNQQYVEPLSKIEKALCELWQSVLNIKVVGVDDNFFDLGGNSVLAITIAYRMSKILQSEIRVADVFRLKTISTIIKDCTPDAQHHLKVLSQTKASDHVFCFIHPAFAGCEVYQTLVDKLSLSYLCLGIENYNFGNDNKITTLSEIAQQYLCYLRLSPNVKDAHKLTLVGWSLGGLIALEMAYWLEQQGQTNVRLIILDSHIPYGRSLRYHPHFNPEKGGQKIDNYINERIANLEPNYAQKILMNKDYDIAIGNCKPTGKLEHITTVLFKATKQIGYKIRDNNTRKYAKYLKLVKVAANHMNIIEEVNKHWSKYEVEFSYKSTKFAPKLQDWIKKIKREIPTLIFVLGAVAVAAYLIGADEYLIATV